MRSPSAIVAIADRGQPPMQAALYAGAAPLVLIADDVQDPGNLGAIVRAPKPGGATSVIAAGACADPFGWKALRGSIGSALRLPLGTAATRRTRPSPSAPPRLPRHRHRPARRRSPVSTSTCAAPRAVLIGGEGPGLDAETIEQADERLTIPMQPPVESLNAAVGGRDRRLRSAAAARTVLHGCAQRP